jgi:hypothetical protein
MRGAVADFLMMSNFASVIARGCASLSLSCPCSSGAFIIYCPAAAAEDGEG